LLLFADGCNDGKCEFNNDSFEIVIGNVNRKICKDFISEREALKKDECLLKITDKKIWIIANNDDALFRGMKSFVCNVSNGNNLETRILKVNLETSFVVKFFAELSVIQQTSVYESNEKFPLEQCTYGKIIKLEHSEKNNGLLLCTREVEGGGSNRYPIYRSSDDGKTWELWSDVYYSNNEDYLAGWQPYLFEIPKDIGKFKSGTIILAGCSRLKVGDNTEMTLYSSEDCGKTWNNFVAVDKMGAFHRGLWEPFLIFDEKTNRVYCFYSDDTEEGHNQKLVYKYSTDFVNWVGDDEKPKRANSFSEPFECTACENKNARPGMVVLTKMGNGEYFTVFEAVGYGEWCQIYYKKTTALDKWDIKDEGKPIFTTDGKSFGSGPCAVWTKNGGDCGTLFVTGAHMVTGSKRSENDLFLSFDYGNTFIAVENPVIYKHGEKNRCGYSAGFYADKSGSVYYMMNKDSKKYAEDLIFTKLEIK